MSLTRFRTLLGAASLASMFALSSLALAGKATISSTEGGNIEIEYALGLLRVGMPGTDGYMLIRDDTMFIVSLQGGMPMVFNASSMMKGMAQGAAQMAPSALSYELVDLKDTGRDETIAGMQGDVYVLTFKDDTGAEQSEEVVLTGDERAIEFRDALFSMSAVAENVAGQEAMAKGRDLQQRMESMNVGVLRYGTEMQVTAMSADTVPAERFALPAQPMDMQGLGKMMEAMKNK